MVKRLNIPIRVHRVAVAVVQVEAAADIVHLGLLARVVHTATEIHVVGLRTKDLPRTKDPLLTEETVIREIAAAMTRVVTVTPMVTAKVGTRGVSKSMVLRAVVMAK
jgi:hypothetical protein